MDQWDQIRRAARDTRSGATAIAVLAARGMGALTTKKDVLRAARALLRAHPAMGALWRLAAEAYDADDIQQACASFRTRLSEESRAAAQGLRWATGRRRVVIVTCSSSGAIEHAVRGIAPRVNGVRCAISLPGAEGRRMAAGLRRAGVAAEIFADAAASRACADADLMLVGADAVTEEGVVNKLGTYPLALAAREAGIACYAVCATTTFVPSSLPRHGALFESTPLSLFDAVLTERGPRRPAAIRRAVERVVIPAAIARIKT